MEAKLKVNGVDFSRWIKAEGLQFERVSRQSRDVTTMDGTLYRSEISKQAISVELVELRDNTLALLKTGMLTSPATVEATDENGQTVTGTYYISGPSYTAKTVRGGNTYFSGVSFELEEQ